jgi:hypothetical protein
MLATVIGAIGAFVCVYLANRDNEYTNNIECQKVKQKKARPKLERQFIRVYSSDQMSSQESSQSDQLDQKSTPESSKKSAQSDQMSSQNPTVPDLDVSRELKKQKIDAPFVEADSNMEKQTYVKDGFVTAVDTSTIMIHNSNLELVESPVTVDDCTGDVKTTIDHTVMLLAEMKEKASQNINAPSKSPKPTDI